MIFGNTGEVLFTDEQVEAMSKKEMYENCDEIQAKHGPTRAAELCREWFFNQKAKKEESRGQEEV